MGDGYVPFPTCSSGEPPGTRTLNPLIKSQQGMEQWVLPLNFAGFAAITQVFLSELARFSTASLHAIVCESGGTRKQW